MEIANQIGDGQERVICSGASGLQGQARGVPGRKAQPNVRVLGRKCHPVRLQAKHGAIPLPHG